MKKTIKTILLCFLLTIGFMIPVLAYDDDDYADIFDLDGVNDEYTDDYISVENDNFSISYYKSGPVDPHKTKIYMIDDGIDIVANTKNEDAVFKSITINGQPAEVEDEDEFLYTFKESGTYEIEFTDTNDNSYTEKVTFYEWAPSNNIYYIGEEYSDEERTENDTFNYFIEYFNYNEIEDGEFLFYDEDYSGKEVYLIFGTINPTKNMPAVSFENDDINNSLLYNYARAKDGEFYYQSNYKLALDETQKIILTNPDNSSEKKTITILSGDAAAKYSEELEHDIPDESDDTEDDTEVSEDEDIKEIIPAPVVIPPMEESIEIDNTSATTETTEAKNETIIEEKTIVIKTNDDIKVVTENKAIETETTVANDNNIPVIPTNQVTEETASTDKVTKPAKVKGIKGKKKGKKKAYITWKSVAGAEKYEVQIALSKNMKKYPNKAKTPTTYITTSKLKGKKTYYFRVRAINSAGKGKWSKVIKVKIK